MTIKERIMRFYKNHKVFVWMFVVNYFFKHICYVSSGYDKYGVLVYQPFTFMNIVLSFIVARVVILTDIRAHGYMGAMDYLVAFIKQVCLFMLILFFFIFIADMEKKYFGTTYIGDLFIQFDDEMCLSRENVSKRAPKMLAPWST